MNFRYVALLLALIAVSSAACKDLYDSSKSSIMPINKNNFEAQVNKIRQQTKQVTVVHFYKANDGTSKQLAPIFQQFVNEYLGIFKIGFCNCDVETALCQKEKITTTPVVRVYPPLPIPVTDLEGEFTKENIIKTAAKYLQSNIIEVNAANVNTFINDSPSVPKVLLFTDKPQTAMLYKGLSIAFEEKLFFGIVRSSEEKVVERYNIKNYPTIIVVKATEKKPNIYKGEMKFKPIFDYLNIFSEVFVPGGGSSNESAATKSWMTELVPEMTEHSANDICLKQEGVLCVIAMNNGKPHDDIIKIMKDLHAIYDRKIQRGLEFKFMWMDYSLEKSWGDLFKINNNGETKIVILNAGKRKRYIIHDDQITVAALRITFDRIQGGDAKFELIKNQLPTLSFRKL